MNLTMKTKSIAMLITTLLLNSSALALGNPKVINFSVDKATDPYYQVSQIVVKEITSISDLADPVDSLGLEASVLDKTDLSKIALVIDGLIAIGKKIWPIIEAGRPVVDVNMAKGVSVIPFKNGDNYDATFYEMENWSMPKIRKYNVTYKNGFGSKVVSFDYTVHYQHSGSFNGKGKYLAGINVVASNISVAWGFNFQASSELIQISNHGSKENQIAGGTFRVNYTAKTVVKTISSSDTFHVNGLGELTKF